MRSIVTILSFILLCIQLSAQEKIEALKLISDICEKNISIDDFKKQYSDYFIRKVIICKPPFEAVQLNIQNL